MRKFRTIFFLILYLLINASAYSAIESSSGGGSLEDYVPYIGALNDVDLGSHNFKGYKITAKQLWLEDSTGSPTYGKLITDPNDHLEIRAYNGIIFFTDDGGGIKQMAYFTDTGYMNLNCGDYDDYIYVRVLSNVPEISTSGSCDLKINPDLGLRLSPDAMGDISCFDTRQLGDTSDGMKFRIWRKAAEGDSSIEIYGQDNKAIAIDVDNHLIFRSTYYDGRFYFYPQNATTYYFSIDETNLNFSSERGIRLNVYGKNYLILDALSAVVPGGDNTIDLGRYGGGSDNQRWRNLYIADSITDGANIIAMDATGLKLQGNALNDVTLFGDADVADNDPSRKFRLWRKAAEGDTKIEIGVDSYKIVDFIIDGAAYGVRWTFDADMQWATEIAPHSKMKFQPYGQGAVEIFDACNSSTDSWAYVTQAGYISVVSDERWIKWQVLDADDWFHLTREDSNILGFEIEMPLKLTSDASGDVTCFEDTQVGDASDGKKFIVYRKASEGNSYIMLWNSNMGDCYLDGISLDGSRYFIIGNSMNGKIRIGQGNETGVEILNNAAGGVDFFKYAGSGENPYIKQSGYITAITDRRYIGWQVSDIDDYFHLTREDINILGFKIEMPTIIQDSTGVIMEADRGTTDTDITYIALYNADGEKCYIYPNADQNGLVVAAAKP